MSTQPCIESRSEQHYIGVRAVMSMEDLERRIPELMKEATAKVAAMGLQASGSSFLRYHVIDMPGRLDVELGVPVNSRDAKGTPGVQLLPAGRYATLTYLDDSDGVTANARLLSWIDEQGDHAESHDSTFGEVFDARQETFLGDGSNDADGKGRQTEVAIKLRDPA